MVLAYLKFSPKELKDIFISIVAIGIILSIGSATQFAQALGFTTQPLLVGTLLYTLIVTISFLPHELAHKYVAIRYNCHAQYEMWMMGLLIALGLAVITGGNFIFIAPGAVVIYTHFVSHRGTHNVRLSSRQNAIISAAGPLTNMVLSIIALALLFTVASTTISTALLFNVAYINALFAMFNLLPFPPLDGSKIIWWNILSWAALMAISVGLYMFIRML